MKKVLKGKCFANVEEVKQKMAEVKQKRHQNWQIQKLFWAVKKKSWWGIASNEEYFEGDLSLNMLRTNTQFL